MTSLIAICATALVAAAPEAGVITVTSTSAEASAFYVEAFDQLFAGHGDLARAAAKRALAIDPNQLLSKALLNAITPGAESMKNVDDAAAAGASLPEAERTELRAWSAAKHADNEKSRALQLELLKLAPNDWRAHSYVGNTAFFFGHDAGKGKAELSEAARLNPNAISPWAALAAIAVDRGDRSGAADAFRHVADARPNDPAAQADYAYALITAGKLDEAESVARKATALPDSGAKPFAALANVELYQAQYAKAHQNLARARSLSKDDFERMGFFGFEALGYTAEGKYQGALQSLAALEKEARKAKNANFYVASATQRAFAADLLGKFGEARKHVAEAQARLKKEDLSDAGRRGLQQGIQVAAIWAQAFGGAVADAEKTLAEIEQQAEAEPNNENLRSTAAWGRGIVRLARGDAKGAAAETQKCLPAFDLCHFHMALAQEKAGDAAAAQATRATLLAQQRSQDGFFLTLRSQLLKKGKPFASADAKEGAKPN